MVGGLLGRLADNRQVQTAADHASDVLEGHALVANGVVARSCGTLLQYELKPEAPVTKTRICFLLESDSCLPESLLTNRQDFD